MDAREADDREPKAVALRAWSKLALGDMDGMLEDVGPNATWQLMGVQGLLPRDGRFVGKDQVAELFARAHRNYVFSGLRLEVTSVFVAGPVVVLEFTMDTATVKGGRHYDERIVVLRIEDGAIQSAREWVNTLRLKTDLIDPV